MKSNIVHEFVCIRQYVPDWAAGQDHPELQRVVIKRLMECVANEPWLANVLWAQTFWAWQWRPWDIEFIHIMDMLTKQGIGTPAIRTVVKLAGRTAEYGDHAQILFDAVYEGDSCKVVDLWRAMGNKTGSSALFWMGEVYAYLLSKGEKELAREVVDSNDSAVPAPIMTWFRSMYRVHFRDTEDDFEGGGGTRSILLAVDQGFSPGRKVGPNRRSRAGRGFAPTTQEGVSLASGADP